MCIIKFDLNEMYQLTYIARVIGDFLEREFKNNEVRRINYLSDEYGVESNVKFQLISGKTKELALNYLLTFFKETIKDDIRFYYNNGQTLFPYLPMFKNVIIRYTEYIISSENPDKESVWKIIGEELSKSGVDFKVLDYIKNNNQPLWHRIYNEINDVGSKMGNLGF